MQDLSRFIHPMQPIPARMEAAIRCDVHQSDFPGVSHAASVFSAWDASEDGVRRDEQGRVLVRCTTALPGVTPAMVDWWFGWHMPAAERYRLWHPQAHIWSAAKENRMRESGDRERYIGNVSYVNEYIGERLMRLAIAFFPPGEIGLLEAYANGATAVCARTSDRMLQGDGGCLVHRVVPTPTGSEMQSAFWLGEVNLKLPLAGRVLRPLLNTRLMRGVLVSDRMALDLLRHCAEEMNHLSRFLPALYAEVHAGNS